MAYVILVGGLFFVVVKIGQTVINRSGPYEDGSQAADIAGEINARGTYDTPAYGRKQKGRRYH